LKIIGVEIVEVFCKKKGPLPTKKASLDAIQVRDVGEQIASRLKKGTSEAQKVDRLGHVFQDIPKCYNIKRKVR